MVRCEGWRYDEQMKACQRSCFCCCCCWSGGGGGGGGEGCEENAGNNHSVNYSTTYNKRFK